MKVRKSTKIYIRRQKQEIRKSGVGSEEKFTLLAKLYKDLGIVKPIKKAIPK
jgi:hypothetical protein